MKKRGDHRPPLRAVQQVPEWLIWLPVLFVIGSLLTLIIVPLLLHREIDQLRATIESTVEPARLDTGELKLSLALQEASLRGYLLGGEPEFLERYQAARKILGVVSHDRFWQSKKTAHLGAGLGLSIAKGIVESHHGRISVENAPQGGASFRFTLPVDESG